MGNVETADTNLVHLFPPFAEKVKLILAQVNHETEGKLPGIHGWIVEEGFRSQARQNWLYAQGRTRPGSIVTYKTGATGNHPKGLAVDIWPVDQHGNVIWSPNGSCWQWLGHAVRTQKMQTGQDYPKLNGGRFVDDPHVEPPLWQSLLWTIPARAYLKRIGVI